MIKRTASRPATLSPLATESLSRVTGGELTATDGKKPYVVDFKWQPETTTYSKTSG